MDIILVSDRLAKARTVTVSLPQMALLALAGIGSIIVMTTVLNYVALRYAADLKLPYSYRLFVSGQQDDTRRGESYLRENLNAMAGRPGEMQAQTLRLGTLGERLGKLAGFH